LFLYFGHELIKLNYFTRPPRDLVSHGKGRGTKRAGDFKDLTNFKDLYADHKTWQLFCIQILLVFFKQEIALKEVTFGHRGPRVRNI